MIDDGVGQAMLVREGSVAEEASHSHLTTVVGSQLCEDRVRSVLPYYEGVTVDRLLTAWQARPPAAGHALCIARQIAGALAALHASRWLHGQVMARHVIVSPQGHATLIDLAGARRLESQECDVTWPSPMAPAPAPELFGRGQRLTAAADIYALGMLLFEMLVGRPVFDAHSAKRVAQCHLRERPVEVRACRSDVSREVNELVWRMLAKDPLRRPNVEEVVRWLAEVEIAELA